MNKKLVGMLTAVVSVFLCAFGFAGYEEPEQGRRDRARRRCADGAFVYG